MAYGVMRGDYGVGRRRGDFLSTIGKIAGSVVSAVVPGGGLLTQGAALVAGALGGGKGPSLPAAMGGLRTALGTPGRAFKAGFNLATGGSGMTEAGRPRRRMKPRQTKALNRALRPGNSFGSLVSRSKKSVAKANRALNPGRRSR